MKQHPTLEDLFFVLFLVPFVILLACVALYYWVKFRLAGRKDQISIEDYKA